MNFQFKSKPYPHQLETLEASWDKPFYGIFAEQGTGKTKITIDTGVVLFAEKQIRSILVLAPNGVHTNWLVNEFPLHCPIPWESYAWVSHPRKKDVQEQYDLMRPSDKLKVLAMNIEAIRTQKGADFADDFMKDFAPCLLVIDESTIIKNPKALQTKIAFILGKQAKYRRALSGTPIANNPIDIWSQCRFLSPAALPYKSYTAFKERFAVQKSMTFGPRSFTKIVGFRDLDLLQEHLKTFSVRILKKDCLNLPDKIYQTVYVELDPKQRKAYEDLKTRSYMQFEGEEQQGKIIQAAAVLAVMIKLQQVTSGFIKDNDGQYCELSDARLRALDEIISRGLEADPSHKFIIWCVFKHSVDRVHRILSDGYGPDSCVTYYGDTVSQDRMGNVASFQLRPECRFFIGNSAAARGLTLTGAGTSVYFENGYSLETRLQSEDRNHRIGKETSPLYIDIIARSSLDEKILASLKNKQDLASQVLDWKSFFREP